MANSIQSGVGFTTFTDGVIALSPAKLAPLGAFSRQFSTNPLAPRSSVYVMLGSSAATAQTNPTDYETGNNTLSGSSVTVDLISVSWQVSDADYQQGITFGHMDEQNITAFAKKINDLALAPVSSANFGTASCNLSISASSFSTTELKSLRTDLSSYDTINVVLDGTCYSQLLPTSLTSFVPAQGASIYGFDGVYENTRLASAGTAVNAFACSPNAVVIVAGIPARSAAVNGILEGSKVITIPGLNFPCLAEEWVSAKGRSQWRSLSTVFGANYGDKSALRYFIGK